MGLPALQQDKDPVGAQPRKVGAECDGTGVRGGRRMDAQPSELVVSEAISDAWSI